jgi:hypothetical protein
MKIRRQAPVEHYLKLQRRYAHLFRPEVRQDIIDHLQQRADRNIRRFCLIAEDTVAEPPSDDEPRSQTEETNASILLEERH